MTQKSVQLQSTDEAGSTTVVLLDPAAGGVVRTYATRTHAHTVDWFVGAGPGQAACFAMAPFCSRIRNAKFKYENHEVRLTPNNPPETHVIHGHGWQRAWEVVALTSNQVVLGYEHEPGEWPWAYSITADYRLAGRALSVSLAVENRSHESMPLGLGLHPYLPCTPDTKLWASVGRWLQLDADLMPVAVAELPPELAPATGILPGQIPMDHVFLDWPGQATVHWGAQPSAGLPVRRMLLYSTAPYLVIWSPVGEEFFCVEGVTNVPDPFSDRTAGLVHPDQGYAVLAPGGKHVKSWRFEPGFTFEQESTDVA